MWNINPHNGYGPDGRRLYFKGGGDGGAGEMRRQEEERQRRTREAHNRINEIFGGEIVEYVPQTTEVRTPLSKKQVTSYTPQQTRVAPGQFGDDYFTSISDKFLQFQQPLFHEQATEARRRLPMQFSSTGSSAYLRKLGELETDVTREESMLKDKARGFADDKRAEVERNRADLTSMASSGTDAAVIANQANARAAALSQAPVFEPIADLFQKYTATAANTALARGGQMGPITSRPLLFPSRSQSVRVVA